MRQKTTGGKARRFGVVFMFFRLFRPEENKQNRAGYFEYFSCIFVKRSLIFSRRDCGSIISAYVPYCIAQNCIAFGLATISTVNMPLSLLLTLISAPNQSIISSMSRSGVYHDALACPQTYKAARLKVPCNRCRFCIPGRISAACVHRRKSAFL